MKSLRSASLFDPLDEGQMVIVAARWVLVLAGLILILIDTQSVGLNTIRFEIMVILALAVSNFYFAAQVLTKRKAPESAIYAASLADLGVITLIVVVQGGFQSNVYTFYFPAILAFSVAFATPILYLFVGGVVTVYGLIGVATLELDAFSADLQALVVRLLMLAAVGVCGNYFAGVERRRQAALQQKVPLETPIDPHPAPAPAQHARPLR
jgi:hypothetical protein